MDARLVPIQELCILSGRETFVVRDILATMQTPIVNDSVYLDDAGLARFCQFIRPQTPEKKREACRPDVIGRWTR